MNQAIQEIEHHLHNVEVWLEPLDPALVVAGVNQAKVIGTRPTIAMPYFEIDAGNETWGTWVCILGSGDTPTQLGAPSDLEGSKHYDLHKIGIQNSEKNVPQVIQFGFGTVAGGAPGTLTGKYTTVWFNPTAATGKTESIYFMAPHASAAYGIVAGTQCWARALAPNEDTAWVRFNIGLHYYYA